MGPNYDIQIHHLCKLESLVEKIQHCYFAQPNHNSALPLYKLTNGRTTMQWWTVPYTVQCPPLSIKYDSHSPCPSYAI